MNYNFQTPTKLYGILNDSEKRNSLWILIMMIFMAFIDALGVASIMPFMAVANNPEIIQKNDLLREVYAYLNFSSSIDFIISLGVFVLIFLVFSLSFKALTNFYQLKFAYKQESLLSSKLLSHYLKQNYVWFLDKNTSSLSKTVLSEVSVVIHNSLLPLMNFIAQGLVSLSLLILLLIVNPILTGLVGLIIIGTYVIIFIFSKGYLKNIGEKRMKSNEDRYRSASEAFGAIKAIKLGNFEINYISKFKNAANEYAYFQSSALVIAQLPRFILEMIAFGGLILVLIIALSSGNNLGEMMPVLSVFAFAGYKLMPSLQQVYAAASQMQFGIEGLKNLHQELNEVDELIRSFKQEKNEKIIFDKVVKLENISFKYPLSNDNTFDSLTLEFSKNNMTAIVGPSGSGKSTILDILLGLIKPSKGYVKIDNQIIQWNDIKLWQNKIGYVPQDIYLSDESIALNIAFGTQVENIDMKKIIEVAKIAQIHDFISNELNEGYETKVGDRGLRLSGGQKQRIGIARALYKNPEVLILDEATSALDNISEQKFISDLEMLSHSLTVIVVAHRLSTVINSDKIYLILDGKVSSSGTYNELVQQSEFFNKMTKTYSDKNLVEV